VAKPEAVSRNKRLIKFIFYSICLLLLLGGQQGVTGQKGEQVSKSLSFFFF
jgi:hypothetical protein